MNSKGFVFTLIKKDARFTGQFITRNAPVSINFDIWAYIIFF